MRQYEFMMILKGDLEEKAREDLIAEIKAEMKENGIKVAKEDVWGDKELAYKIAGCANGYYLLYTLEVKDATSALINMDRFFAIKPSVVRHMFVKLED